MRPETKSQDSDVRISIVVACRNEIKHIRSLLDSILAQDLDGIAWEAIIADGMSNDGTQQVVEEYSARHPQIRLIANTGRFVSTGLNAAIRAARGEIIMRMDAHTFYAPDYCRRSLEVLEQTGADNVGGPARTRTTGVRARAVAAGYHSPFSTGGARFHNQNFEGWVDTVPYGCWKKSTLERLGMFDEELVRNQDDELNLRITRRGGRVWQSPSIVSWYSPRPTLSALFRQYFQYGFWKVKVIQKHRLPASWRHLVPVTFVVANLLMLAGMAIAAALGANRALTYIGALWLVQAIAYVALCLTASVLAARKAGWATLPYLPAVFAVFHFSYGLGFLAGARWLFRKLAPKPGGESVYARITR